jgi:hypothetical protein
VVDNYSSTAAVQCYDMNRGSIQWGTNPNVDFCGGAGQKQCPQYMSICMKP